MTRRAKPCLQYNEHRTCVECLVFVDASWRARVLVVNDSQWAASLLLTFHDWTATLNASSSEPNRTANIPRGSLRTSKCIYEARGVDPRWTWAAEGLNPKRKRDALQPLRSLALRSGPSVGEMLQLRRQSKGAPALVLELQG